MSENGYCFMTIEKVKDKGSLTRKYQHNYRTGKVPNADPELLHKNEELVKLGGKTYVEKFDEIMNRLREQNPKIRKNAVLALEIVTTFSRDKIESVDLEKWKSDQVKWLRENFNPNPEEFGDNVVSVMFHGDEAGNVHCHSVIIPIDDKGHLNASYFLDGRAAMIKLQDSYGDMMEERHGLKRGLRGSSAKHEDIKRFYAAQNMALAQEGPEIRTVKGRKETVEEYKERSDEYIKDLHLKMLAMQKEHERTIAEMRTLSLQERLDYYKKKKKLETDTGLLEGIENLKEVVSKGNVMDELYEGLQHYPDKDKAKLVNDAIVDIVKFERERKEEIKRTGKK